MNANLIAWIDSHDRPESTVDNGNGTLTVYSVELTWTLAGERDVEIVSNVIPATMAAARDLLGY
jgi:hypothetical protein